MAAEDPERWKDPVDRAPVIKLLLLKESVTRPLCEKDSKEPENILLYERNENN